MQVSFNVDPRVLGRLVGKYQGQVNQLQRATRRAVATAAEEVGLKSARLTPVAQGYLRRSRIVRHGPAPGPIFSVIGSGGPTASYAKWVHWRRRDRRSGKVIQHRPPTQSHYLSQPLLEELRTWPGGLANRIRAQGWP